MQLGQVVVPQLQVKYNGIATLKRLHRLVDVRHVRRLAQNVQPILFHLANARTDVGDRRACLLTRLPGNNIDENVNYSQDNDSSHFRSGDTQSAPIRDSLTSRFVCNEQAEMTQLLNHFALSIGFLALAVEWDGNLNRH